MAKITVDNYIDATKSMDLSKLTAFQREKHEFAVQNIDLYNDDDDIRDAIDLAIKMVNEINEEGEKAENEFKPTMNQFLQQKEAIDLLKKEAFRMLKKDKFGYYYYPSTANDAKYLIGRAKEVGVQISNLQFVNDLTDLYDVYFDAVLIAKKTKKQVKAPKSERQKAKFKKGDYVQYECGDVHKEEWFGIVREVVDLVKEYAYNIDGYGLSRDGWLSNTANSNQKYEVQLKKSTKKLFEGAKKQYMMGRNTTPKFKKGDKVKIVGLESERFGTVDKYQNDLVLVHLKKEDPEVKLSWGSFHEQNLQKVTAAEYKKGIAKVKPKKEPVLKATKPAATEVEVVPVEVTYIRSFLKMNGDTVSYAEMRKKLSKMQKDIVLKKIRKTSSFAPQIDKIQNSYMYLIKEMNKNKADSIKINIDPATISFLTSGLNITQSAEIKIIKRFLNLYAIKKNKAEMLEKAKKLGNDIQFLIEKNIITPKSAHHAEILKIQKDLKEFVSTQKMDVSSYVLDGLNKIMNTNYSCKTEKKKALNGVQNISQLHSEETNADKAFNDLKTYVDMVIDGTQPALIISGPAGIGKTHLVKERLKEKNAPFVYIKGRATAAALFVSLYENNHKTIVFDDCDSIIKSGNEDALNILKAVLDSYDVREVSWLAVKKPILDAQGEEIPKTFEFDGQVIFLTNIPLKEMKEALLSRSFKVELNLSIEEIIQKMKKTLPTLNTNAPLYVREKALQTILDLYNTGADIELNMRTLQQAIRIMQKVSESEAAKRMIAQQCATIK